MPRIPERIIESVFFLYASKEDAEAGKDPGGTGFVVSTGNKLRSGSRTHYYGVTNWHVAVNRGFPVIRINSPGRDPQIFDLGPEDWEYIPRGPDVAITELELGRHPSEGPSISIGHFSLNRSDYGGNLRDRACVGDDVFMLGLFVDHHGFGSGVPGARFGNISMLPNEKIPIKQKTGYYGESYVVDMHSRTGHSGSPVFVFRTLGSDLTTDRLRVESIVDKPDSLITEIKYRSLFHFLGIHWGQFPEIWELKNKRDISENRKPHLIMNNSYVEGMSGMTCVIPAWEIVKVLELPKFRGIREKTTESDAELSAKS